MKKEGPNPAWLNKLMFAIEEKQRSDLARDLHDSVLQDMISLKHQSEMFLADFEKDKVCTNQIRQRLINMNEQMSAVIQTTRETCQEPEAAAVVRSRTCQSPFETGGAASGVLIDR